MVGFSSLSANLRLKDLPSFFSSQWTSHRSLLGSDQHTDLVLLTDQGQVVGAHQAVLVPHSRLLAGLLTPGKDLIISLPGVEMEILWLLLEIIYTGSCKLRTFDWTELQTLLISLGFSDISGQLDLREEEVSMTLSTSEDESPNTDTQDSGEYSDEPALNTLETGMNGGDKELLNQPTKTVNDNTKFTNKVTETDIYNQEDFVCEVCGDIISLSENLEHVCCREYREKDQILVEKSEAIEDSNSNSLEQISSQYENNTVEDVETMADIHETNDNHDKVNKTPVESLSTNEIYEVREDKDLEEVVLLLDEGNLKNGPLMLKECPLMTKAEDKKPDFVETNDNIDTKMETAIVEDIAVERITDFDEKGAPFVKRNPRRSRRKSKLCQSNSKSENNNNLDEKKEIASGSLSRGKNVIVNNDEDVVLVDENTGRSRRKVKNVACKICGLVETSELHLKIHYTKCHFFSEVSFLVKDNKCQQCGLTSNNHSLLVNHVGAEHNMVMQFVDRESGKCHLCNQPLGSREEARWLVNLANHLVTKHFKKRLLTMLQLGQVECHLCNKRFRSSGFLVNHLGVQHGLALRFYKHELARKSRGARKEEVEPRGQRRKKLPQASEATNEKMEGNNKANFHNDVISDQEKAETISTRATKKTGERNNQTIYENKNCLLDKASNSEQAEGILTYNKEDSKAEILSNKCPMCETVIEGVRGKLNFPILSHYSTTHFMERLLEDFSTPEGGCSVCGKVFVPGKKRQFLIHLGAKHRLVERYLGEAGGTSSPMESNEFPDKKIIENEVKGGEETEPDVCCDKLSGTENVSEDDTQDLSTVSGGFLTVSQCQRHDECDCPVLECKACQLTNLHLVDLQTHLVTKHFRADVEAAVRRMFAVTGGVCPRCPGVRWRAGGRPNDWLLRHFATKHGVVDDLEVKRVPDQLAGINEYNVRKIVDKVLIDASQ